MRGSRYKSHSVRGGKRSMAQEYEGRPPGKLSHLSPSSDGRRSRYRCSLCGAIWGATSELSEGSLLRGTNTLPTGLMFSHQYVRVLQNEGNRSNKQVHAKHRSLKFRSRGKDPCALMSTGRTSRVLGAKVSVMILALEERTAARSQSKYRIKLPESKRSTISA